MVAELAKIKCGGTPDLMRGIQTAQLALKHRQNKNQRQRIVLFTGSPVGVDQAALVKIGKKLKKNNVAVDVVCFGDPDQENTEKLEAFLSAVNSNDNSHLVLVPLGAILSDCLLTSPICQSEDGTPMAGGGGGAAAAGGTDYEFGVDPNIDPELALALRVSMEEERARQEAANKEAGGDIAEASSQPPAAEIPAVAETVSGPEIAMDDDALLQQALALSMAEGADAATPVPAAPATDAFMGQEEDGDAAMALAIQMSMADQQSEGGAPAAGAADGGDANMNQVLGDAEFVNSVLASLQGVDPNDPSVREALANLGQQQQGEEGKKEEDK